MGRTGAKALGPPWADAALQALGAVGEGALQGPAAAAHRERGRAGVDGRAPLRVPVVLSQVFLCPVCPSLPLLSHVPSLRMLSLDPPPQHAVPSSEGSW